MMGGRCREVPWGAVGRSPWGTRSVRGDNVNPPCHIILLYIMNHYKQSRPELNWLRLFLLKLLSHIVSNLVGEHLWRRSDFMNWFLKIEILIAAASLPRARRRYSRLSLPRTRPTLREHLRNTSSREYRRPAPPVYLLSPLAWPASGVSPFVLELVPPVSYTLYLTTLHHFPSHPPRSLQSDRACSYLSRR